MALDQDFSQDFPYVTAGADVQKALSDMGRPAGVTVRLDPAVQGRVLFDNSAGSNQSFLEEAVSQTSATWWYDGVILYVELSFKTG